jgi:hypothetical protein
MLVAMLSVHARRCELPICEQHGRDRWIRLVPGPLEGEGLDRSLNPLAHFGAPSSNVPIGLFGQEKPIASRSVCFCQAETQDAVERGGSPETRRRPSSNLHGGVEGGDLLGKGVRDLGAQPVDPFPQRRARRVVESLALLRAQPRRAFHAEPAPRRPRALLAAPAPDYHIQGGSVAPEGPHHLGYWTEILARGGAMGEA